MLNREFLQLAKNFNPAKHGIGGWYVSEKLDGMRAYWDGGLTRGRPASEVFFANTAKDHIRVTPPIATGLWSRYGNIIHAPDWFLDLLPEIPLDGELYLARGEFQETMSIVKQLVPDSRWVAIKYMVFDSPSDTCMFLPGRINNPNFKLIMPNDGREATDRNNVLPFYGTLNMLESVLSGVLSPSQSDSNNIQLLQQTRLPSQTAAAMEMVNSMLDEVTDGGGEGLMLRKPDSVWYPKRVDDLVKIKKLLDGEGTVVGYTWGKGKLEGLMGALVLRLANGVRLELSGFTDAERDLRCERSSHGEPGTIAGKTDSVINLNFPFDSTVTFRYTELSKDGVPLKARYWRK